MAEAKYGRSAGQGWARTELVNMGAHATANQPAAHPPRIGREAACQSRCGTPAAVIAVVPRRAPAGPAAWCSGRCSLCGAGAGMGLSVSTVIPASSNPAMSPNGEIALLGLALVTVRGSWMPADLSSLGKLSGTEAYRLPSTACSRQ